ncbi:MAG: T9SS type A sorting domain-containing protein [Bacteroidota bacterium]|nr:T9SS type A sorting domain-containing protein [Bacteroidota bacterium]
MRSIATVILMFSLVLFARQSNAQLEIRIDPTFGNAGRTVVNIGGLNNEVTAFNAERGKPTTVCGKISTALPGIYRLGIVQVDTGGKLDAGFGTSGIVDMAWSATDYPLDLKVLDNGVILSGVSGSSAAPAAEIPTVYLFKFNGTPDSSFGHFGRVQMQFDDRSSGEAANVYFGGFNTYVACGRSLASEGGVSGFGVMRLKSDGTLDSSFAFNGRAIIPALVHSVQGFFLNDRRIFMCGISDTGRPELLVARFTEFGWADSAVGTNGLIHTGIYLAPDKNIFAAFEGDNKIMILLPTPDSLPTPITLCRFDPHGFLDAGYGIGGFARNEISTSFTPKGLDVLGDYGCVVSGLENSGIGRSMFMKINDTSGHLDPRFSTTPIAVDVDNGNQNFLQFIWTLGKTDPSGVIKRFIGVGSSVKDGVGSFMITRFLGIQKSAVFSSPESDNSSIEVYPDPVVSSFKIKCGDERVRTVRVIDALGREILKVGAEGYSPDEHTFSLNALNIPNGIYFCLAEGSGHSMVQKFVVSH